MLAFIEKKQHTNSTFGFLPTHKVKKENQKSYFFTIALEKRYYEVYN
jgi:hypothetical protein